MVARDDAMEYICGDGYDAKERLDEVEKIFRADERAKTIDDFIAFAKQCSRELMYVGYDGASTCYGDGWLEEDLEMLVEPFIHGIDEKGN